MSTSDQSPLVSEAVLAELTERGQAIYDKLKSQLEPEHNNRYVAIHVDTEDYAIGRNYSTALREILKRHPVDGRLFGRRIGSKPDYSLAARVLTSEMIKADKR